jgi:quercetin dioxygenase-like cupin family protein
MDEKTARSHWITLSRGDSFHIPVGMIHQFSALKDSEIIEISTQHFDEDSYRIEKGD